MGLSISPIAENYDMLANTILSKGLFLKDTLVAIITVRADLSHIQRVLSRNTCGFSFLFRKYVFGLCVAIKPQYLYSNLIKYLLRIISE